MNPKTVYYKEMGFTTDWPTYIHQLCERDEAPLWNKESVLPKLPPLKVEKRKVNYLNLIRP